MFYKAKTNLTVGFKDRGTVEFKSGQLYKHAELGDEVDMTNFEELSDDEARAHIERSGKKTSHVLKTDSGSAQTGDIV